MPEYKRTYEIREDNPVRAAIEAVEAPQGVFYDLGQRSPVARHSTGTTLFRFDDIVRITARTDVLGFGAPGPAMGSPRPNIPLDLDGPLHRSFRKALNPLFTPKAIGHLEKDIRRVVNELIDSFDGRDRVELYSEFCVPLPAQVFLTWVGLPVEDADFLNELADKVGRPNRYTSSDAAAMTLLTETAERAMEYLDGQVRARGGGPAGDDFMYRLIHLEVDGVRVTHEQVLDMLWLLVLAGLDTSTASMACIFAWFAEHPTERQRVVDDPEVVPRAIEELMRYQSPVAQGDRYASQDMEVGGVPIPAGECIKVSWAGANMDPDVFKDPLTVDFDRPPGKSHLAFASGFHRCIGSHLARLELRCAVEEFHRRIPGYSIVEDDQPRWVFEATRGPKYLPLNLQWR